MNWSGLFASILFWSTVSVSQPADLLIAGTLDFCDGLGKISYGLIDHLSDQLSIVYSNSHVCTLYHDPYNLREYLKKGADSSNARVFLYTNPLVTLLSNDCYRQVGQDTIKIAYSMFEADRIPEECVHRLNEQFDAIVIPDPFLFEVYRNSGVTRPLFCVPTGLYLERLLALPTKKPGSGPFTFGCASNDVYRKNLRKLVDCFIERYGNNNEYQLKLHVKYAFCDGKESLEDYVERKGIYNIEISSDALDEDEYVEFLRSLDCYVLLSTGEGFSNTPREAMAAGIPCIISDNTGHTTLCESGYVVSVPCPERIDAWYEAFSKNVGNQFDCQMSAVIEAMEKVVDNYEYYFQKAQEGRQWVQRYLWPQLKETYLTLLSPLFVEKAESDYLVEETRTIFTQDERLYKKLQHHCGQGRFDVTLAAPAGFCDGIGRISYGLIDALSDTLSLGLYQSAQRNRAYDRYIEMDDPYNVCKKMMFAKTPLQAPVFLYIDSMNGYLQDPSYNEVPDTFVRLAYSMFESSAIPTQVVNNLNRYFDAAVVPDPYHIKVYRDSGVTIPIFCLPTGLYLEKFLEQPLKQAQHSPFTFGCIASNGKRKNIKKIIEAFARCYGNNSNYLLKLHTKKNTMHEVTLDIVEQGVGRLLERVEGEGRTIADFFKSLPVPEETPQEMVQRLGVTNVVISTEIMTEQEYINFFQSLDCYLSVSTGEGFSNTPREALALGMPCIVSNNTAQTTICKSEHVIALESPIEIEACYEGFSEPLGKQYDCTIESLCDALHDAVENYSEHLLKAAKGREWVKQYLWSALKPDYCTLLKPTRVVLGQADTIDAASQTITTTSSDFAQKLQQVLGCA